MADNQETRETDNASNEATGTERPDGATDNSRRQFAKAGGAVMATLLSRPALGVECTPSLLRSWNVSAHPDLVECRFACSPGFYKTETPGANSMHAWCEWTNHCPVAYGPTQKFIDVFNPGPFRQRLDADGPADDSNPILDPFPDRTLQDVLNMGNEREKNLPAAGMHAVAALINATHDVVSTAYPFPAQQVIDDFMIVYRNYEATGGNSNVLDGFLDTYDIYEGNGFACPLPQNNCSGGIGQHK